MWEVGMHYRLDGNGLETENDDWWIAPTAVVIGKVRLEADASVWWGAVLRGDNEPIVLGRGSNIQDGTVCHTDPGTPLLIGPQVTVGHMAMLHGCVIGEGSLIGIGAVVLNGARVGRNCLIAAKALVGENKEIPDNSVVMGVPGKVVGEVRPEQAERMRRGSLRYVGNWKRYRDGLVVES
jgi:carbonic anhydrase/acetyltransferase-like protein (isoleucine patch superfamily)